MILIGNCRVVDIQVVQILPRFLVASKYDFGVSRIPSRVLAVTVQFIFEHANFLLQLIDYLALSQHIDGHSHVEVLVFFFLAKSRRWTCGTDFLDYLLISFQFEFCYSFFQLGFEQLSAPDAPNDKQNESNAEKNQRNHLESGESGLFVILFVKTLKFTTF